MNRCLILAMALATAGGCRADRATNAPGVGKIVIAPVTEPLLQRQPKALSVTVTSTAGQVIEAPTVVWTSSDTAVATVNAAGVVMPLQPGPVRIIATAGIAASWIDLVVHIRWLDLALAQSWTGACGIAADSAAYCWGTLVGRDGGMAPARRPTLVPGNRRYGSIGLSGNSACAVASDRRVYCWGNNDFGQLGDGTRNSSLTPVPVEGVSGAAQVAVGSNFACATTTSDQLFCWGSDEFGQIGDGGASTNLVRPPTLLTGVPPVSKLSLSGVHGCALAVNTALYCWGYGPWGTTGIPSSDYSVTPGRSASPLLFRDVFASTYVTCGAATSGGIYCWGLYASGSASPRLVPGTDTFTRIAVTSVTIPHSCAIGPSGVSCWGNAAALGRDPSESDITTPTLIAGSASFVRLEVSSTTTCALSANGVAYCWGESALGDGTTGRSATPVMVADPE